MLYINEPKSYITYADAVAIVIKSGIEPQRAYIYLAALGVRGAPTRVLNQDTLVYSAPIKVAVKDNKMIKTIKLCKSCKGLTIDY